MAERTTSTRKRNAAGKKAARKMQPASKPPGSPGASKRIDRMIAVLDDWRGERLAGIRALIREVAPDVVEDWKWHGAQLRDPRGLF